MTDPAACTPGTTLTALLGNSQRLDGGAMFGNAPRAVWARWIAPDDQNRIPLACRCMLIEAPGKRILVETGIGAFFEPKYRARFGVQEDRHVLLDSLAELGLSDADIDVVVLSHLHFDHAGGLLAAWQADTPHRLLFPNATFVVGREAWDRALDPHPRDRASFIPELPGLLQASGRLEIVDGDTAEALGPDYFFHRSDGHTPGQILLHVPSCAGGPVVFAGDLVPGVPWMHLPITMGYDRYPERLIDEKAALLGDLLPHGGRLFFTHDPHVALAKVIRDDHGRFGPGETWAAPRRLPL
ncbi:MAG: MBL fold metallo-hydrolase [Myxococcales bacterium]|nr:MBL fold metallo-hydrolase [Myxococcales bacterium]MCB9523023.1 MBL fold metallo-hydrolase [Myxococcales bacterium]